MGAGNQIGYQIGNYILLRLRTAILVLKLLGLLTGLFTSPVRLIKTLRRLLFGVTSVFIDLPGTGFDQLIIQLIQSYSLRQRRQTLLYRVLGYRQTLLLRESHALREDFGAAQRLVLITRQLDQQSS